MILLTRAENVENGIPYFVKKSLMASSETSVTPLSPDGFEDGMIIVHPGSASSHIMAAPLQSYCLDLVTSEPEKLVLRLKIIYGSH